jgi:hypothetical protein
MALRCRLMFKDSSDLPAMPPGGLPQPLRAANQAQCHPAQHHAVRADRSFEGCGLPALEGIHEFRRRATLRPPDERSLDGVSPCIAPLLSSIVGVASRCEPSSHPA